MSVGTPPNHHTHDMLRWHFDKSCAGKVNPAALARCTTLTLRSSLHWHS